MLDMMHRNTTAALLAIGVLLGGPLHRGAAQEAALHFLAGLAAGSLSNAVLFATLDGLHPEQAPPALAGAAAGSSLLVGALKEIADLRGYGDPSWLDLGMTVLGGVAAGSLGAAAGALAADEPRARGALSAVWACFGVVLSLPVAEELARRAKRGPPPPTPASGPRS
jgi:hypothetical protein